MTQYVQGSETTQRESLVDVITVRSPYMTPMLRQLPHKTIPNVVHEYSIDDPFLASDNVRSISDPHIDARREGADFSYRGTTYPTRLRCIAEIKHHGMEMSGSARAANIAGADNPWDYRAGYLMTLHLNSIDNTLMYGQGSPEVGGGTATTGPTTAGDERRTQGLIHWAGWTGTERMHGGGANTVIEDPYGIQIPARNWSVFYNFNHTSITLDSMYNNVLNPLTNNGADLESTPWTFWCGNLMMQRVARFMLADGGVPINERTRSADDGMGADYLHTFRVASGHVISFRTNRWLNETGSTYSINNTDYTPGNPSEAGSQSTTFYGDQTLIGYEPGSVMIGWYREPGFRNVATAGDYSRVAAVSEVALEVRHPLCVGGAGNALA